MHYKLLAVLGSAVCLSASAAFSQSASGFYGGGGLFYGDIESTALVGTGTSNTNPAGLSFLVGHKWDQGTYSLGLEFDGDISLDGDSDGLCGVAASGSYLCEHKATLRFRGVVATQLAAAEIFGALGVGMAFGDFATNATTIESANVAGYTVGIGANFPINQSVSIRGEINYDNFTNSSQTAPLDSDYEAVSARVMAIFKF